MEIRWEEYPGTLKRERKGFVMDCSARWPDDATGPMCMGVYYDDGAWQAAYWPRCNGANTGYIPPQPTAEAAMALATALFRLES